MATPTMAGGPMPYKTTLDDDMMASPAFPFVRDLQAWMAADKSKRGPRPFPLDDKYKMSENDQGLMIQMLARLFEGETSAGAPGAPGVNTSPEPTPTRAPPSY